MSFLSNIAPIIGAAGLAYSLFNKPKSPKIEIPPLPEPKEPLKSPVNPSMTAASAKARITARSRQGRGIGGLILSRVGGQGATPTRQTLLGSSGG